MLTVAGIPEQANPRRTPQNRNFPIWPFPPSIRNLIMLIPMIGIALGMLWMTGATKNPSGSSASLIPYQNVIYAHKNGTPVHEYWRNAVSIPLGFYLTESTDQHIHFWLGFNKHWFLIELHGEIYEDVFVWVHDETRPKDIVKMIESTWNVEVFNLCVEWRVWYAIVPWFDCENLGKYTTVGQFRKAIGQHWDQCIFKINGLLCGVRFGYDGGGKMH